MIKNRLYYSCGYEELLAYISLYLTLEYCGLRNTQEFIFGESEFLVHFSFIENNAFFLPLWYTTNARMEWIL